MSFDTVILGVIVLFAYLIGTAIGFASSILTVTIAAIFMDIKFLVPVVVPLNIVIYAYLLARYHEAIERRLLLRTILPLTLCGLPIGLLTFRFVEMENRKWVFGLFVVALAVLELIRLARAKDAANTRARPLGSIWTVLLLFCGGILQGLWVSGGPMIAYWASRNLASKGGFRTTLAALWLILNVVILIGHLSLGVAGVDSFKQALFLLPVLVVAVILGEMLYGRLSERKFKILVYVILAIAGLTLIPH